MHKPDFTPDELICIHTASKGDAYNGIAYDLASLVPGTALLWYGYTDQEPLALLIALAVFYAFRGYDWYNQIRYAKVWRSIIRKYEASLAEAPATVGTQQS